MLGEVTHFVAFELVSRQSAERQSEGIPDRKRGRMQLIVTE